MALLAAKNDETVSSKKAGVSNITAVNLEKTPVENLNGAKIKKSEIIMLSTQLSVMLDSGVVLSDALDAIARQAQDGKI